LLGEFINIPEGASLTQVGFTGTIPSLAKGQEVNLNSTFVIADESQLGQFTNFAVVNATNAQQTEASVNIDVVRELPVLQLTKSADVNNGLVNYIVTLRNDSKFVTRNIVLIDNSTLAGNFINLPNDFIENSQHIGFEGTIESISPNTIVNLSFAQQIPLGSPTAEHTNNILAKVDNEEIANATADFSIDGAPLPIVSINQTTDRIINDYTGGETITYVIEVSNTSDNIVAKNVVLNDNSTVPGIFTTTPCLNLPPNKQKFECIVGDLAPGQTYIATTKYLINNGASGKYYNRVDAKSATAPTVHKEIEINVIGAK